jgi:tripartite-type tricarboxylate transporter receptor subunit TctC
MTAFAAPPSRLNAGAALALLVALLGAGSAGAQAWPARSVTLVVPFAAGGNVDIAARVFAREISAKLGQQVVIENKPGAGGGVASAQVAKAKPDGYTLLLTATGPAVFNKMLYKSIPYDPDNDFTPIVITNDVPQVLVVNPKSPIQSVKDLVALAREKKGALTLGHAGAGTTGHLACLLFMAQTGIETVLVSYRGAAPLITDVLGGQIDAGFPAYVPQVESVKSLGVTTEERLGFLPQTPTVRESGVADVVATTWNALLGPAGLPPEIVERLNTIVNDFLKTDTARKELAPLGARPLGGTPQDVVKTMERDKAKWGPIIKAANIVLEP